MPMDGHDQVLDPVQLFIISTHTRGSHRFFFAGAGERIHSLIPMIRTGMIGTWHNRASLSAPG